MHASARIRQRTSSIRLALTGRTASPGLFEVMEVLGKEKVLERMRNAAEA